jgi:hypothetical protein
MEFEDIISNSKFIKFSISLELFCMEVKPYIMVMITRMHNTTI